MVVLALAEAQVVCGRCPGQMFAKVRIKTDNTGSVPKCASHPAPLSLSNMTAPISPSAFRPIKGVDLNGWCTALTQRPGQAAGSARPAHVQGCGKPPRLQYHSHPALEMLLPSFLGLFPDWVLLFS